MMLIQLLLHILISEKQYNVVSLYMLDNKLLISEQPDKSNNVITHVPTLE